MKTTILSNLGQMANETITQTTTLSDINFGIILGGFGLFLLGIKFLGDGLKDVAGSKIRDYIEKYTGSLWSSIVVGTIITALMQSSTAATVISISLVRAGLMSLKQAIGISVGANLGTTVTALMIGFDIEQFGYYFLFIGAIILLFANRKVYQNIAWIIFGFGITFVGLDIMSSQLNLLQELPEFESFIRVTSENNWLALLAGTVATAIINSSMAVIAIVQQIYGNSGMTMEAASAFVFGSNIGTCLTAVLASTGGSVSTKRAGWFHALYNIIGALIMMLVITPYSNFIIWLNQVVGGSPAMAVALNHFVFNLLFVVLVIPFVPMFITMLEWLIPGEDKIVSREKIKPFDYGLIETYPEGAIQVAHNTTVQMADLVLESIQTSKNYLYSKDNEDFDVVMQLEEMINQLDHDITKYLLQIVKRSERDSMAEDYTSNLEIVKNLERMSDLATNLVEFYKLMFDAKEELSEQAIQDLDTMYLLLINMIERSISMLKNKDTKGYTKLKADEDYLDLIEVKYREKHFRRMADNICNTKVGSSVYIDILGILERIGDHTINIAEYVYVGATRDLKTVESKIVNI
nr:putative Na/Pi-cotransporter family protein [uncultured bacterium]